MKLRNYITAGSLLALLALNTGCTSEEIIEKIPDIEVPGSNIREVSFNFGGLKLKKDSPATRAETIATAEETEVDNLVIILAGVDDETRTTDGAAVIYEYRHTWATPPVETDRYKRLDLVQTGNVLTGKLLVDETVMSPAFVWKKALVLVNGVMLNGISATGVVTPISILDLVNQTVNNIYLMCGGSIDGQDMAALGVGMKLSCEPADIAANDIECPLPMFTRVENINFHGSTNLNIQLKRLVSRFDLRNGQSAGLRIGSIRPMNATTNIGFDEATETRVDMQDQSFLPATPDTDWANVPAEVVPAFYTFPSALVQNNQEMKFRVTAKRLNGQTGTWDDKTYTLKLEDTDRRPVSIDANTRYVINITEVTDLHITAGIVVAEWEQGGDVDGDLTPGNTTSRKTPVLNDIADDAANQIAWTTDANGVPTALRFGRVFEGQTIKFSTPAELGIDPNDPAADQPKVSIDIFKEAGEDNPGKVWLQATEGVTTRAAGDTEHTFTVGGGDAGQYPVLYVKVKNYYFPEQFVMFRVTALAGDKTVVDMEGDDNPVDIPDGWTQNPDTDEFEEGVTAAAPSPVASGNAVYEVNGFWITAPAANEGQTYAWTATSSLCTGNGNWRMPTMKDFEEIFGWTTRLPWSPENCYNVQNLRYGAFSRAFPLNGFTCSWWSSTERDDSNAYEFSIENSGATAKYSYTGKSRGYGVRCVQKQ